MVKKTTVPAQTNRLPRVLFAVPLRYYDRIGICFASIVNYMALSLGMRMAKVRLNTLIRHQMTFVVLIPEVTNLQPASHSFIKLSSSLVSYEDHPNQVILRKLK